MPIEKKVKMSPLKIESSEAHRQMANVHRELKKLAKVLYGKSPALIKKLEKNYLASIEASRKSLEKERNALIEALEKDFKAARGEIDNELSNIPEDARH